MDWARTSIYWFIIFNMEINLESIAKALVAPGKGILAADESFPTIEKRFEAIHIPSTEENRFVYRRILFSTPGIEEFLSGIIMFDETLREEMPINPKIMRGIKVDEGTVQLADHADEKVTEGLGTLATRLQEYKKLNAVFTKWRAVFTITPKTPTIQCVETNSKLLAEYARICQDNGFVPIVEPEVLMDGDHNIDRCAEVTRAVLKIVFMKLNEEAVNLKAILLKPNMILPGKDSPDKSTPEEIAQKTIEVLKEVVPQEVPGIVFLSGGQTPDEATRNLREMNKFINLSSQDALPWQLSFSFGRALQEEALKAWKGKDENIKIAQKKFHDRAKIAGDARYGK